MMEEETPSNLLTAAWRAPSKARTNTRRNVVANEIGDACSFGYKTNQNSTQCVEDNLIGSASCN